MVEHPDEDLVRQCLEGNREAFGQLVEKYQKVVFNVALRMVHGYADAEDVAQVAFVKAYKKLKTFDPKFRFFSWLYRIVMNESLNFLKQRRHYEPLDDDLVSDSALGSNSNEEGVGKEEWEVEREIQKGLMELNVDYRAVLVLKHFQELSYAEIGRILDIPEKTVKSRLFTARANLKDILRKKGFGHHGR